MIGSKLTEPAPIRLYSTWRSILFSLLECSGLNDITVLVPDGFAPREHLDSRRLFGIAVEIFTCRVSALVMITYQKSAQKDEKRTFDPLKCELAPTGRRRLLLPLAPL
jgi:hypothetical protein